MAKVTRKKKMRPFSIIAFTLCACIILYFVVAIVKEYVELNDNKTELNQKQTVLADQVAENDAKEAEISEGDIEELAEQYAREKGYIMPDERVCIDITPGT